MFDHFGPRKAQNLVYMGQKTCATSRTSQNVRMFRALAETRCTKPPCSYTPRPPPYTPRADQKEVVYTEKGSYTPRMAVYTKIFQTGPVCQKADTQQIKNSAARTPKKAVVPGCFKPSKRAQPYPAGADLQKGYPRARDTLHGHRNQ